MPNAKTLFLAATLALAPLAPLPALAEGPNHIQITRNTMGSTQHVEVGLNKSLILDLPRDAAEVIVSEPKTAAAIMRSKRRAIIQGKAVGETNIFFLDKGGARIAVLDISVTQDASGLQALLARLLPGSKIGVETFNTNKTSRVILSGTAPSTDAVDKAKAIAAQFAGGDANVASVINVSGTQQVALKVTVAEVSRETIKQLGIDLSGGFSVGGLSTSLVNTPGLGGASGEVTTNGGSIGGTFGGFNIQADIKALERRGAIRTLAEPTLTALSGQEAEFLAGGEFPVPSGVDGNTITFTFKKFGANLKFTPTIKSNGIIALNIDTSVSEPTTEGGFSLNGVTIPATKNRQAKTSVEMRSGQTLVIAGLIEDKVRQQFNALPGIGNVPILGALFRSRDFIRSQSELVILVTPKLASAGGPVPLPTDNVHFAGDAEAIFLGHMESLYGVGDPDSSAHTGYGGSVGFVLD